MYIEISYAVYLAISLGVTIWVAKTLHRNGLVFLVDAFRYLFKFFDCHSTAHLSS